MNLVDSSGWLEYFGDSPNASFFAQAIEEASELVVAAVSIYEMIIGDSDGVVRLAAAAFRR